MSQTLLSGSHQGWMDKLAYHSFELHDTQVFWRGCGMQIYLTRG